MQLLRLPSLSGLAGTAPCTQLTGWVGQPAIAPQGMSWPPESAAEMMGRLSTVADLEVLSVCSHTDEANSSLAHPLAAAGGAVAFAYATKQGRVRLLEVLSRLSRDDVAKAGRDKRAQIVDSVESAPEHESAAAV